MAADDLGGTNAQVEDRGSEAQGSSSEGAPDSAQPQAGPGPVTATEVLRYVVANRDGPPQEFGDARSAASYPPMWRATPS